MIREIIFVFVIFFCFGSLFMKSEIVIIYFFTSFTKKVLGPGPCGSVGLTLTHKSKGHRFDSWSGHRPGLWVASLVCRGRSMFLSHTEFSLPLFFPPFPSPWN